MLDAAARKCSTGPPVRLDGESGRRRRAHPSIPPRGGAAGSPPAVGAGAPLRRAREDRPTSLSFACLDGEESPPLDSSPERAAGGPPPGDWGGIWVGLTPLSLSPLSFPRRGAPNVEPLPCAIGAVAPPYSCHETDVGSRCCPARCLRCGYEIFLCKRNIAHPERAPPIPIGVRFRPTRRSARDLTS